MAPQPRARTVPCDKCRAPQPGDGGTPCSNCDRASTSCVRVAKQFRVKRLISSQNSFKFDPNQTWIQTRNQKKTRDSLPIIHESDDARSRTTRKSTHTIDESSLTAAAEELQSFSRYGQPGHNEDASSSTLEQENSPQSHGDGHMIHAGIQDNTGIDESESLSQPTTPTTFIYDKVPIPPGSVSDHETPSSIWASSHRGGAPPLDLQEGCLVRCFIEKLAMSFDTSDRDHHYLNVVPLRAMYSPLLLNAICTASARYLTQICSRRNHRGGVDYNGVELPGLTEQSAIHYHNKCISYLMDVSADPARSCSDDALTAITILRYHEQVDNQQLTIPAHFTGIDSEIFSIAVQAVFQAQQEQSSGLWRLTLQPPRDRDIFAASMPSLRHSACLIALRQEIWSVLIHRRPFRLPILAANDYANFDDIAAADDHDWTNCIIFWCAHVLKFCFSDEDSLSIEDKRTRSEQWNALKAFEKNWDERPPPHFAPLYYKERNPSEGRYFPTIWHTNQSQIMALQHVELARIILAVHDSKLQRIGIGATAAYQALEDVLRQSTRRICALGLGDKKFQAAMVTAGVGISMCGEYFHDAGEQAAIIDLLSTLESEHAWPTSTAVSALKTAWNEHRARNT
ncbi:hypothetical protein QQZ08_004020 [Neonectria magnoliae]|uniref:ARCA protein n=1 Tax=Neonectria magnoliae TaxID=2732573 RepID=A0ABR1I755_9HYPO